MANARMVDVSPIGPFDCANSTGIAAQWKRWIRAFELYADGKGVENAAQRKALLLHTAGMETQDIFFTLTLVEGDAGDSAYVIAKKTLDHYFTPLSNVPYERHTFRSMAQEANETIEQYITRLRVKAETCEFGVIDLVDEQIRDQVVEKCASNHLRHKLLEKGRTLTLKNVRDTARALEDSERQARSIEGISANVNKLSLCEKPRERPRDTTPKAKPPKQSTVICFSCGYQGHKSKDPNCPAKGRKCRKCSNLGHFEARCKSKISVDPKVQKGQKWRPPGKNVRQISMLQGGGDQDDYAFIISNVMHGDNDITLDVTVGGVQIPMIVDSGATVNVVGRNQWEHLKSMGIKCQSSCDAITNLYAYGSSEPLPVAGNFTADVAICGNALGDVQFNVIEGNGQSLLGRDTAQRLNVLKVGPQLTHINTVEQNTSILSEFPEVTSGFGKLKDYKLKIPIDDSVQPVVPPER